MDKVIEKHDYVEIDYILYDQDNKVVDTTIEEVAKENNLKLSKDKLKPFSLIVGEGFVVKGLDKALEGRKEGEEFEVELEPKEAFGEYNPKLIFLIPMKYFREKNIKPTPGLVVNVDGLIGVVKSISGGRVLVDFNHPLAGKKVKFKVFIRKVLKDDNIKEKLEKVLYEIFNLKDYLDSYKLDEENKILELVFKKPLPTNSVKSISESLKKWFKLKNVKVSYLF